MQAEGKWKGKVLVDMWKTGPEWGRSPWPDVVRPVCSVGIAAVGPSGLSKGVWARGQQSISDEGPREASLTPGPVMGRIIIKQA